MITMTGIGMSEKKKYLMQHTQLMIEVLLDKKGDSVDVLDWVVLGKHYTKNGEEEIAYQCYMMPHLLDHERIGNNSQLPFDTIKLD